MLSRWRFATVVALLIAVVALAQSPRGKRGSTENDEFEGGSFIRLEGGGLVDEDTVRTARETASHSTGTPTWSNERGFEHDVFTFARIMFRVNRYARGGFRGGGWMGWV